jgi:hypothetical protein
MTEALRAQIKEQLIANNLCSDTSNTTDVETATNNTATTVSASLDAMRLDGLKATDTPPMTAHKSVSTTLASHPVCKFCVLTVHRDVFFTSQVQPVQTRAEGTNRSRAVSMDMPATGTEAENDAAAADDADAPAQKLRPVFTGYAFHYVKEYLKEAVRTHLSLVIDVDLPRAMKLDTSGDGVNAKGLLRKMGAAGLPPRPPGVSAAPASVPSAGVPASVPVRTRQVSVKQRYSLLSSRKTSVSAGGAADARRPSMAEKLLYTPNQGNAVQQEAEQSGTDDAYGGAGGSSAGPSAAPQAHGIFTCTILGPLISRRFYMLWYDIDGMDASRGICTMLMKNERRALRLFRQPAPALPPASQRTFDFMQPAAVAPSPLTLSLRTSAIGAYITDSMPSAPPGVPAPSSPAPRSKVAAARLKEHEKANGDDMRRNKFKSTSVLSRFNLLLKTSAHDHTALLDQLSVLSHVGVFKSFRSKLILSAAREEQVEWNVASFIDEARAILPHVLSVNIAADAVFLSEPVICPGPEVTAELASTVVMHLLRVGSRCIIRRKIVLETALQAYKDAAAALDNASDMDERLVRSSDELHLVMRKLIKDIDACRKETEAIQRTCEHSHNYELECMLREDAFSRRQEAISFEGTMEALINPIRKRIFSYSSADWQTFATPFTSRPSKPYLELMRALMIAIRFTPPKGKGAKGNTSGKMDDETVSRCAAQLLTKSADFASHLCTLVPSSLPSSHLQALRTLNLLLNSTIAPYINCEQQSPHSRLKYMQERCESDMTPANNVYEALKKYLLLVDVAASIAEYANGVQTRADSCMQDANRVAHENAETRHQMAAQLKARNDAYMAQMHHIDATLTRNRQQLETIERNNAKKGDILRGMRQASAFAQAELTQVKDVLRYLVTDCCVAVAVLLRAGWLPEQLRQECMEQLRQNLIKHDVRVSDTPFILGHLADRLQMRQWTPQNEHGLPRDPASINAMALVHLVPYYALIVDPDGTAPGILLADPLEGYDKFTITAQKFSLATFHTWLASVADRPDAAVSVIITDLQAGISDDLVCFLSSDFVDYAAMAESHSDAPSGTGNVTAAGSPREPQSTGGSPRTQQNTAHHDHRSAQPLEGVSLVVNPSLDVNGESHSAQRVATHRSTDNDHRDHDGSSPAPGTGGPASQRAIHIPCRFRLYLVSAKAPSMDQYGVSRPLPTSCLKNITIVHWAVNTLPSHYLESKPNSAATEKHYVSDQALSYRMGAQVCKKLSPLHFQYHTLVNNMLISDELNLYALEDDLLHSVYQWQCNAHHSGSEHEEAPITAVIAKDSAPARLSLLDGDTTLSALIEAIEARHKYTVDIEMNKTLQRELVTFQGTVTEVCSMAVDFLRTCAFYLPPEILTPYALTSQALCSTFLAGVLDLAEKKRFLKGLPASLAEMVRVSKAIVKVQRRVRAGTWRRRTTIAAPRTATHGNAPMTMSSRSSRFSQRDRRRSSVQQITTHELSHKRFGLMQNSREQAACDLACLLLPLRTFLLREVVNYVQLSLRPGLEWLGKFMFVLTTWSQSESPLPAEEVRTLMHFVMQAAQQSAPRFSHFVSFNGVEKGDLTRDLASLARYTRESTLNMRRSRSGGSSRARSASGSGEGVERRQSRLQSPTGRIGDQSQYIDSDSLRSRSASSGGGEDLYGSRDLDALTDAAAEEAEGYDEFVADLPSAGTMQNRVTAFRVNEQPKMRASVRFSDGDGPASGGEGSGDAALGPSKRYSGIASTSTIATAPSVAAKMQWMERGAGLLDGLWLNRRSTRWRLNPQDQHYFLPSNTAAKLLRGRYVMLDVQGSNFSLKNTLFRPTARQGDSFEAEWLRVKGIRLFATSGPAAAAALGASQKTLDELQASRKKTYLSPAKPVFIASTAAAQSGSAGAAVQVTGGGAFRREPSMRKASASGGAVARSRESKVRKSSRKSVAKTLSDVTGSGGAPTTPLRAGAPPSGAPSSARASFTSKHRRLSITAESLPELHSEGESSPEKSTGPSPIKATSPVPASKEVPVTPVMNVAARTLHSGRVSMALANMTSGVGDHRSTLVFGEQRASVASTTGGSGGSAASASPQKGRASIAQLCLRKASQVEHKQRGSQTPSPADFNAGSPSARSTQAYVDPLQGLRSRFNADGPNAESIVDLLTSPLAFQNMLMLESHANLAPIFKGLAAGITRNIQDFADWKAALFALSSVDPVKLSDKDLEVLLFTVKPPVFDDFEDENPDHPRAVDEGLWLKGYELTMIQSLLLSEAIVPGSAGSLVEVMFALIVAYLRRDGHVAHHPDETAGEDQSDSDEDFDFEEEDEDGDSFDVHSSALSRHASNVRSSVFSVAGSLRNNSASSVHSEITRSTFFQGLDAFRRMARVSFQEGVALINCWDKLERVLNGTSKERGPQYVRPANVAQSALTCRDFENWESVLLEVLSEDVGMEKYVFMKELRDSTLGTKSSLFLASHLHSGQMAVFSQRARDLAVHNYDHISVINCASPANEELNQKQHRAQLMEAIRNIKTAVASQRSKKAIVEMLNLQSPYGNSLISSVLLHAGHASSGTAQKSHDASQHYDMSVLNTHAPQKNNADAVLAVADRAKMQSHGRAGNLPWHWSFPLIISSQWGAVSAGCGPVMTLADLSYTWLPRFFSPDVIHAEGTSSSETLYVKFAGLPPTLAESCGILCEEMESSLLWVMNCTKSLAKSHLTGEIRQRLRKASRIEIRVTAALVTIWQLGQYVRCSRREESDVPAAWSACLNPVSLWQLTRLMLKTSDVLQAPWEGANIASLLKQENYAKAMWLMAESFSNTECYIYNFKSMFEPSGKSGGSGAAGSASAQQAARKTASASMIQKGAEGLGAGSTHMVAMTSGSGRPATTPARSTYIQQLKRTSKAGVGAVTGMVRPRMSIRREATNMSPLVMSALTAPVTSSEEAGMSNRAKKLMKRAMRHVEEARLQYVQTLCAQDKFSLKYVREEESSIPEGHQTSDADFAHTAEAAQKTTALEKEFMNRFLSLMGIYFAQVLLEAKHLSGAATGTRTEDSFASIASLTNRALDARRQSNKINIKSFLDMQKPAQGGEPREFWPEISESVDFSFGSLSAADVIKCMVKWTFNGGEASASKARGKVNNQKIINSLKKLSLLIKAGKVTL